MWLQRRLQGGENVRGTLEDHWAVKIRQGRGAVATSPWEIRAQVHRGRQALVLCVPLSGGSGLLSFPEGMGEETFGKGDTKREHSFTPVECF